MNLREPPTASRNSTREKQQMEWRDTGIVTRTHPFGEGHALVDLLTKNHGRMRGLVYGGMSRRQIGILQLGNTVLVDWHQRSVRGGGGRIAVEPIFLRTAAILQRPAVLYALHAMAEFLAELPENGPCPRLYALLLHVLDSFDPLINFAAWVARFEVLFLMELGFGLDLRACPIKGETESLAWVSPRTGRAVSASAGAPYAARLLALPPFLLEPPSPLYEEKNAPKEEELMAAFRLTGYFLEKHVYTKDSRKNLPATRSLFLARLQKAAAEDFGKDRV